MEEKAGEPIEQAMIMYTPPHHWIECARGYHEPTESEQEQLFTLPLGESVRTICSRCGKEIKLVREQDCKDDEYYVEEL